MKITYLDSVDSTQIHLKNLVKKKQVEPPYAVLAHMQTGGLGSRDNSWRGYRGNLFLSFAIELQDLPSDLKLESASIYFSYILKEILSSCNSKVWLKWPNDFYVNNKKIGGMITNLVSDTLICGVGINLAKAPIDGDKLDIDIDKEKILVKYFKNIEKKISWKQIFSKYRLEFYLNKNFYTHNKNNKISLSSAVLEDDGSISVDGERIYSLR